jgi:Zn-dependent protease
MPTCYHCGKNISQNEAYKCSECGQTYCQIHKNPIDHECNIVKESLTQQQFQPQTPQPATNYQNPTQPNYVAVNQGSPSMQDRINQQQAPPQDYLQQTGQAESKDSEVRGTTDGSFTWYRQERYVPENAFSEDSGIEFKGILLPYKSEFLHLLIGSLLIFIIGFIGFYNEQLIEQGMLWAIFMLAGFYTTAFLFHEFGHRQVAIYFKFQTKFRLLSFGMILTAFGLISGIAGLLSTGVPLPTLALPGAVVVLGLDKINRKTGLCKAAGPSVNLVYGTILMIVSFLIDPRSYPLNLFIGLAAGLNFTLGLFNMIPLGILDGKNIFKWNKMVYFFLFAALLILLIITYGSVYAPPASNPYIPQELRALYQT